MTSTRLPGKAMVDIAGRPLTDWILDRARQCTRFDDVLLACPAGPEDDPLESRYAARCAVYRGSLHNVLDRFWNAARLAGADIIVRVTGDNPLLDPAVMDAAVTAFIGRDVDYASTADCPLGIGAEVFTFDALDRAHREATEPYQQEHVTPYLYESPGRFRTTSLDVSAFRFGLGHASVRLTVDTTDDLELVRELYLRLLPANPWFGLKEIADLHGREPELFSKNRHVRQKTYKESQLGA